MKKVIKSNVVIRKMIECISRCWLKTCFFTSQMLVSLFAFADEPVLGDNNLGTAATKLNGEFTAGKTMLWTLSQAVGICLTMAGCILWWKISHHRSDKSIGSAIAMIAIGACLYFLPYLMGQAGSSILSV
jgi:hypothetical protein